MTYVYEAPWSRTLVDKPWTKTNTDIVLIQHIQSGQFKYALIGNIKYKEVHIQMHHDFQHKGEYQNIRYVCYDGDNLIPYKNGMKEMCEMTKIHGDYITNLTDSSGGGVDDRRIIAENGQQCDNAFLKEQPNNATSVRVFWYQRDMNKVKKFWTGSDYSGWTINSKYIKCGGCNGSGCNECNYEKYITKIDYISAQQKQQEEQKMLERKRLERERLEKERLEKERLEKER
eukprot:218778_1